MSVARLISWLAWTWLVLALVLCLPIEKSLFAAVPSFEIYSWFLYKQDLPVLEGLSAAAALLLIAARPIAWLADRAQGLVPAWPHSARATLVTTAIVAGVALVVTWIGTRWVFDGYGLSRDEDMANFGAAILARGQLMATIPAPWRAFAHALEPKFVTFAPGGVAWAPDYLPMASAVRALAGLIGARDLSSPLLAAAAILAAYACGRRLAPRRPDLALIGALLTATSAQVLITAMTPYAMTAHLAFDLVWLALFLRGGRLGHGGALIVGFIACGLHQLAFHPLFVAPFVLQLWLERRWRTAILYTATYAAFALFWVEYGAILMAVYGVAGHAAGAAGTPASGSLASSFAERAAALVRTFRLSDWRVMDFNFIRLVTWQNPLTVILAILGAPAAFQARGAMRSLVLGLVLTTLVMLVVMPSQGHGWGYRYWHGLLGSLALIAAFAWGRLTEPMTPTRQRAAVLVLATLTVASTVILIPVRAHQAQALVRPYAMAHTAIEAEHSDVVILDDSETWYANDLIRNAPDLGNRPLVMDIHALDDAAVDALCARYSLSLFDARDASSLHMTRTIVTVPGQASEARTEALRGRRCGPSGEAAADVVAVDSHHH